MGDFPHEPPPPPPEIPPDTPADGEWEPSETSDTSSGDSGATDQWPADAEISDCVDAYFENDASGDTSEVFNDAVEPPGISDAFNEAAEQPGATEAFNEAATGTSDTDLPTGDSDDGDGGNEPPLLELPPEPVAQPEHELTPIFNEAARPLEESHETPEATHDRDDWEPPRPPSGPRFAP